MRCDENGFTDATQGAQWDEQRGARAAGAVAGDDHAVGDDGTDVHGAVPLPLGGGGVHDGQDSVAELWLAVRACTSRSKAGCHTDVGAFAIAAATKTVPQERRRRESAPWDIGLRSHREGGGGRTPGCLDVRHAERNRRLAGDGAGQRAVQQGGVVAVCGVLVHGIAREAGGRIVHVSSGHLRADCGQ